MARLARLPGWRLWGHPRGTGPRDARTLSPVCWAGAGRPGPAGLGPSPGRRGSCGWKYAPVHRDGRQNRRKFTLPLIPSSLPPGFDPQFDEVWAVVYLFQILIGNLNQSCTMLRSNLPPADAMESEVALLLWIAGVSCDPVLCKRPGGWDDDYFQFSRAVAAWELSVSCRNVFVQWFHAQIGRNWE